MSDADKFARETNSDVRQGSTNPIIVKRRDYLVEWLKTALKDIPVSISAKDNTISINFQELFICGIDVEEDTYKIFNASIEWADKTTYHCEEAEDGTWLYYLETSEECIDQCKQLVLFEAKKGSGTNKKSISGRIDEPLVSDYWLERIKEEVKQDLRYGEYVTQQGVKKARIECYGEGPRNRMQIWLNPPTSRTPEYLSVWVGDNVVSPGDIKTDIGEKKVYKRSGYQECEIKFFISQDSDRAKDLQNAFDFINEIRAHANK